MKGFRKGKGIVTAAAASGAFLFLFLLSPPRALAVPNDHFQVTSNNAPLSGPSYNVNDVITIEVEAQDANNGNARDLTFQGAVTVGFYSQASGFTTISDPQAGFFNTLTGQSFTGSGPTTFKNGLLNLTVTLKTGSDSESLELQSATTVPGIPVGPYIVQGFSTQMFPVTLTGSTALTTTASLAQGFPAVTLTLPTVQDNAVTFLATGITGGYAFGGAGVSLNLQAFKTGGTATLEYQVILDYNGNLTPAEYDSPPFEDTVYYGSYPLGSSPLGIVFDAPDGGNTPLDTSVTGFQNGKVVLRVWQDPGAGTGFMVIKSTTNPQANSTSVYIPYSGSNVSPVQGHLIPKTVLAASSPTTLIYTINNFFNQDMYSCKINIPHNPDNSPTGGWTFLTTPTTNHTGSSVISTDPSGGSDGSVTINFNSDPVVIGGSANVTLRMNAAVTAYSPWDFGLLEARDGSNNPMQKQSSDAQDITTLGVPPAPGTFTASPSNYATPGTGNQIDLSWSQASLQGANGYILTRRLLPAGAATTITTIPSNATTSFPDTGVANQSSYEYVIRTTNPVTVSGPVTAGPVTAFVNPGPPVGVQAFSGGTTVELRWATPVAVPGSFPVTGYQVWRGSSAGTETFLANVASSPVIFDDFPLSAGVSYFYFMSSLDSQYTSGVTNAAHNSAPSNEISGFPPGNPPLNPAANYQIGTIPDTIRVTWTAPVSNLVAPVGYVVVKTVNGSGPTTFTASSPYDDTGVSPGNLYGYRIAADLGGGVTTNFSPVVSSRVGPSAPSGVTVVASAAAITLTWTGNGIGENVVQYQVVRSPGPTTILIATTSGTTPVTYIHSTAVTQGIDYSYRIQAVSNAPVTGPLSLPVTSALPPLVPQNFIVLSDVTVRSNVDLAWAAPVSGANVNGYNIRRNTSPTFGGSSLVFSGTPSSPVTDTSLGPVTAAGMIFYYFDQALNSGGAGVSVMQGLRIPPNPPGTPTPTTSASAVTLTWVANPGSEAVTYYTVYRDSGSGFVSIGKVNAPGVSFTDSSISAGINYGYHITATNPGSGATIVGGESLPSASIITGLAPTAPTGLAANVDPVSNSVTITWNDVTGNSIGVSIFVDGVFSTTKSAGVTTFIDSSEAANTTHSYGVQAYNPYGGSVTSTISATTYPGTISDFYLTLNADGSRAATWTAMSGPVTGYEVFRSQTSGGPYVPVQAVTGAGPVMPVTLTASIQPGQIYYYVIKAGNSTGQGGYSNQQSVNVPPSVPIGLTAVSGLSNAGVTVNVSWLANSGIENVAGYSLWRSSSNATTATYSQVVSIGGTSYSDSFALPDGNTYYYLVKAHSGSFVADSGLNTTNAVAVTAFALPNPPGSPSATAGTSKIILNWTLPSVTTYNIQGYDIYQSTASGVQGSKINGAPVPGLAVTATGLTNGTTYYYTFQTVDINGNLSPLSSQINETPVLAPSVASNINPVGGDSTIVLTWNSATQGTLPIKEYDIYRVAPPGSGVTVLVGQRAATFSDFTDTGLINGNQYVYFIQTVDSTGVTTSPHASALSSPVTGTPVATVINPPGNVTGIFANNAVTINWSDPVSVTSAPVTGFVLYRATSLGGTYSADVTLAAPLPAGPYAQADMLVPITNGTRYYYYLRSVANNGSGAVSSAPSAIINGIPSAPLLPPTGLTALDGNGQVTLKWTASAASGAVTVLDYVIYQNSVSIAITNGPATTFIDTTVTNGTPVVYTVSTVNSNGIEGNQTLPINAYPYTMSFPTGVTSASTNTDVTVNWTAPGASSYPVTGYSIVRTPLSGGAATTFVDGDGVSPYVDVVGTLGQLYTYAVLGMDGHGHLGTVSAPVTDGRANQPPAPSPFVALAGDNQILLDWAPVTATSSTFAASQYILTRTPGSPVTLPASQTWFLDSNVGNITPVSYTLTVVDTTGQYTSFHMSTPATPVPNPATGNATALNPPTGLTATALSKTSILVNWVPSNDMGRDIDFYTLTRSDTFTGGYGSGINIDADKFPPQVAVTINGLASNHTYYFLLVAHERNTGITSSPSNHAYATTLKQGSGGGGGGGGPTFAGDMVFDKNLVLPLSGGTLTIQFIAPQTGSVDLTVYNVAGNPIYKFPPVSGIGGLQSSVIWDCKDRNGSLVASGIYLIEIKQGSFHQVKKVAVVK